MQLLPETVMVSRAGMSFTPSQIMKARRIRTRARTVEHFPAALQIGALAGKIAR